mmetsp:Transcript_49084/g.106724  ORF Transcript_49084/g.106724 Transcript_49084/m.106724 type:complete len:200 (+) Transcript_49084:1764-2363(+)
MASRALLPRSGGALVQAHGHVDHSPYIPETTDERYSGIEGSLCEVLACQDQLVVHLPLRVSDLKAAPVHRMKRTSIGMHCYVLQYSNPLAHRRHPEAQVLSLGEVCPLIIYGSLGSCLRRGGPSPDTAATPALPALLHTTTSHSVLEEGEVCSIKVSFWSQAEHPAPSLSGAVGGVPFAEGSRCALLLSIAILTESWRR